MLLTALIPLIGGALLSFDKNRIHRARMCMVEGITLLTSVLCYVLIFGRPQSVTLLTISDDFALELAPDNVGKVFLGLIAFLWPLAVLYAGEYMQHEEREHTFFAYYTMTYGVMILLCCAHNLFTLYIMYELLTLVTLPLVLHVKDRDSVRAARSYIRFSIGCAGLAFMAMMFLAYYGIGKFTRSGSMVYGMPRNLLFITYIVGFFGFGVKAAVFPLCAWLPKACAAPTPVTALLHAVAVVNAGVYSVLRFTYYVISPAALHGHWPQYVAMTAAGLTVLFGAIMAVRETHVKRRLAYSTVSNLGYMLFGISLMTTDGLGASMLHLVSHSLMKITLFYCIGAIMCKTGRTQTLQMHGLAKRMPFVFFIFLLGAIALMGIPPLSGFASKYYLITAAVGQGSGAALLGACTLLISSILTAVYTLSMLIPAFTMKFEEDAGQPLPQGKCDPTWRMLVPLIILSLAIIALGVRPQPLYDLLRAAAGM